MAVVRKTEGATSGTDQQSPDSASKRKGAAGGSKLARSAVIGVRLDPKLKYLAELAARKHRRTLSSFIEWAVEHSLRNISLGDASADPRVFDESESLWDVDEADRFAKLALRYPHMLSHDETVLWKLIRENGYLWKGRHDKSTGEWTWRVAEDTLVFEHLRDNWAKFKAVAEERADKLTLPKWLNKGELSKDAKISSLADMDDDIPF
jgi:hypothetical protein